jgi:hypothetical protein
MYIYLYASDDYRVNRVHCVCVNVWCRVTLGNQLDGVKLLDPVVVKAFKERYPDHDCTKPVPRKT